MLGGRSLCRLPLPSHPSPSKRLRADYAVAVLRELARREEAKRGLIERVRAAAHPAQRLFIDHPAKYKAAICSRRAGKSFGVGLALIERALTYPNTKHMYLALTRDSAKRILWDDVLKTINRDLKLGVCKFNETELSVRFSNGSTIYLLGADAKTEEQDKLLGQKYKTVVIDEAASFRTDLRRLVYKTIEPATIDGGGTIMLIGTPGDFIGPPEDRHMFYAVTSGSRRNEVSSDNEENAAGYDWVSFRWNTFDNPHMADKWREALDKKLSRIPHFADTVEYKTEWLGEWALDFSKLVYHFREDRNLVDCAPQDLKWWVIGVDLGFNDATAFHVWGWRPYDGRLYGLESLKIKGLTLDDVNRELNKLRSRYPQARLVIDGAGKQAVEHLRKVYGLPLHAASKTDKAEFIRHMNTDLTTGRIVLVKGRCEALVSEWAALIWDDRARVKKEKDECENHCSDASLYGWRDSLHFAVSTPAKKKPDMFSEEYADKFWDKAEKESRWE